MIISTLKSAIKALRSKQGMFYTLSAIVILLLFFTIWATYTPPSFSSSQLRVQALNAFVKNLQQDAATAGYVSAFRGFIALTDKVEQTGTYNVNIEGSLNELMLNGTLSGTQIGVMINNTLIDWVTKMQVKATELNTNLSLNVNSIKIGQSDPWYVDVTVNVSVNLSDPITQSTWVSNLGSTAHVPIEGLIDPLTIVETQNKFPRAINRTPYSTYIAGSNTANLTNHMINGYFTASPLAPSYLQRLSNVHNTSPYGIESILDKTLLATQLTIYVNRSNVDHVYFWNPGAVTYGVSTMPAIFRLDNTSNASLTRLKTYNASNLAIP